MTKPRPITAMMLFQRLCTVAREAGLERDTMILSASTGDRVFTLTTDNFQVEDGGTLIITEPEWPQENDQADAQRYRYLREFHVSRWHSLIGGPDRCDFSFEGSGHDMDAAIDAARGACAEQDEGTKNAH